MGFLEKRQARIVAKLEAAGDIRALMHELHRSGPYDHLAREALRRMGPTAELHILHLLQEGDDSERSEAALTLADVGTSSAVNGLIAALDDAHLPVRIGATIALIGIGDPRAIEPLEAIAAGEPDPLTQTALERGLPKLRMMAEARKKDLGQRPR